MTVAELQQLADGWAEKFGPDVEIYTLSSQDLSDARSLDESWIFERNQDGETYLTIRVVGS